MRGEGRGGPKRAEDKMLRKGTKMGRGGRKRAGDKMLTKDKDGQRRAEEGRG